MLPIKKKALLCQVIAALVMIQLMIIPVTGWAEQAQEAAPTIKKKKKIAAMEINYF